MVKFENTKEIMVCDNCENEIDKEHIICIDVKKPIFIDGELDHFDYLSDDCMYVCEECFKTKFKSVDQLLKEINTRYYEFFKQFEKMENMKNE